MGLTLQIFRAWALSVTAQIIQAEMLYQNKEVSAVF